jgi:hypothetical protein
MTSRESAVAEMFVEFLEPSPLVDAIDVTGFVELAQEGRASRPRAA